MTPFDKAYLNVVSFKENMRDSQTLVKAIIKLNEMEKQADALYESGNVIQSVLIREEAKKVVQRDFESYMNSISKYIGKVDFIGIA